MSNFRNYINTFEFETVLPGAGSTVVFRPVTTGQIKKLLLYETSNDALSMETALDDMINECVVKPVGFNVGDLYIQDRFFLLVEIRKATRGAQYGFQTVCASCSSQTQQMINISDLMVTTLKKTTTPVVEVKPPIVAVKQKKSKLVEKTVEEVQPVIVVPEQPKTKEWNIVELNNNISVRLSLVTRNMQREAYEIFEAKHKDTNVGDIEKTLELTTLLYGLSITSIISPDGEETGLPLEERIFLLDNIQQSEQEKISKWFEDNDFGIDFSFDVKCAQCGFIEKKAVPVENFFY